CSEAVDIAQKVGLGECVERKGRFVEQQNQPFTYTPPRGIKLTEDHLGSMRHVHDVQSGQWVLSLDYDAFGTIKDVACAQPADSAMPVNAKLSKGFAGLYWHGPTGLYLATYRAYDSYIMRWLNRDPIEEFGGNNLYAYVLNNPVNIVDHDGLVGVPLAFAVVSSVFFVCAYNQYQECIKTCSRCTNHPLQERDPDYKCKPPRDDGNTGPQQSCNVYCVLSLGAGPRGPGAAGSNSLPGG